MDEQDAPTPRRALPPRDEPGSGLPDEDAPQPAPRRGMWSASGGASPSEHGRTTPIPPPAVLPPSDVPGASSGRRYSAEDLPDEERPLPRRSALSPTASRTRSPLSPDEPATDPAPAANQRPRRGALIGAALAVVAVAVAVALMALFNPWGGQSTTASPTPTVDPVATYLMQPGDLSSVRDGIAWEVVTTTETIDTSTPSPKCLTPLVEAETPPLHLMVRTFSPTSGATAGLLHQVERYATAEEAEVAYAERVQQLASCQRNTAWVESGATVTDLADEATGSSVVLQASQPEYHTLVISRTGTRVNVVDATSADEAVPGAALLRALSDTFTRQCSDGGACPGDAAAITEGPPPATEPEGFLAGVDLPRISVGAGEWRGTPVTETVSTTGSRCEALDLATQGTSPARQRSLLLQDDASAPQGFGVDEIIYSFDTPEQAAEFVTRLGDNVGTCADRTATATVSKTSELNGPGVGAAWVVTQRVSQDESTFRYRVATLVAGQHVVYVLVTVPGTFDFTDEAFHDVALRAAERLTQLP